MISLGAATLVYPTPIWVIGTYDKEGKPNLATAAWVGVCCSDPPAVAVSFRKATYSHGNIMEHKAFTVNIPSEKYIKEADYCGIVSGRQHNKFEELELRPLRSELVDAPYIKEFPIIIECRLLDHLEIGRHTQFIGEIMDIKADKNIIGEDNFPDVKRLKPLLYSPGSRAYHGTGEYLGQAYSIGKREK